MSNNTLAVALAALLVGGVATAGYMNNREHAPVDKPVNDASSHNASRIGAVADPVAMGGNMPTSGRVDYAEVLDVRPVTEREPRYATVIGSEPLRESTTTSTPQQVCEDVVTSERLPERDGNVGGTVAGTLIGGLVGNQIGGGNGRKVATLGGAVAGGFIGNRVDRNHVGGQVVNRTDRRCRTVNSSATSSKTVAWNVTYQNPDGTTGSMRTSSKPGRRIALGDGEHTIGYDVSYRLDGRTHTVRMDERPGSQLPVIDGQVVTQVAAVEGNRNG